MRSLAGVRAGTNVGCSMAGGFIWPSQGPRRLSQAWCRYWQLCPMVSGVCGEEPEGLGSRQTSKDMMGHPDSATPSAPKLSLEPCGSRFELFEQAGLREGPGTRPELAGCASGGRKHAVLQGGPEVAEAEPGTEPHRCAEPEALLSLELPEHQFIGQP
jgi:hypothetical protein